MKISYCLKSKKNRRTEQFIPKEPLPFGQLRTDHMFIMDYDGTEWYNPRIIPYQDLSMPPGAVALHYGQAFFEGVKAFMHSDGEIYTFRLDKNAQRANFSADVLCMPQIPIDMQVEAIHALIDVDRKWFPVQDGASLYVRPYMFGTSDALGVHPSEEYKFVVILSPSGPYYPAGFSKPVRLLITKQFHRAVSGGTGAAKAAGNYAASLKAGIFAKKFSASQVLYLDAENKYIEEAGAMNHYHVTKNGEVVIPEFTDSILKSITSESIIELQEELGLKITQKKIEIDSFISDVKSGEIVEAGGLGTAAVISPVGEYVFEDNSVLKVGNGEVGEISKKIYNYYTGIQLGKNPSPQGWLRKVEKLVN